jgi:hypothetical protein
MSASCAITISFVRLINYKPVNKYTNRMQVQVNLCLCLNNWTVCHENIWKSGLIAPPLLTSALNRSKWSASSLRYFIPGEKADNIQCLWGWLGPRPKVIWSRWKFLDPAEDRIPVVHIDIATELFRLLRGYETMLLCGTLGAKFATCREASNCRKKAQWVQGWIYDITSWTTLCGWFVIMINP